MRGSLFPTVLLICALLIATTVGFANSALAQTYEPITPVNAIAEVPLADRFGNPDYTYLDPTNAIDGDTTTMWQAVAGYIAPASASAEVNDSAADNVIDSSTSTYWQAVTGYVAPTSASAEVNSTAAANVIDGNTSTYWQGVTGYMAPASVTAAVNDATALNTIDGDTGTYWQAATSDPNLQWINFDLGVVRKVKGFQETSGAFPGNPFTAFVSTDDVTYQQAASGILTQDSFGQHFFTSRDVRFIKLFVGRTDANGFGELAEFEILVNDAWIRLDLGVVRKVKGFQETSGAFPGNPFTIFVSADDVTYQQVTSGVLTQGGFGQHFFTSRDIRFIKLFVERTDANGFGELVEFQASVDDAWIRFDLGELRKVDGFRETSGPYPGNPYKFHVSIDDITYHDRWVPSSTLTQNDWGERGFSADEAVRYFRFYVQRTDATGYGEFAEFNARVNDAWIKFDLGEVREVAGFRETSGNWPANPFIAFVSTDDVTYVQVASGILTQYDFSTHLFDTPRNVRYFKLFVRRTDACGYGELAEFQALVPVSNRPPVADADGPYTVNEGSSATLDGSGSSDPDPGDLLAYEWDLDNDGEYDDATGVTADVVYGDNGTFTVGIRVTDDYGESDTDTADVTVTNVTPNVMLDTSAAIAFVGGEAFLGREGVEQTHSASATDPGSDDLTLNWSSGATATYFNDGVGPDPFPSPGGVFPFSASDSTSVTFTGPGVYAIAIDVADDDGGADSASLPKLVTGDGDCTRSQGFWKHQFSEKGKHQVDDATLEAYLEIVNFASAVFSEQVPATTIEEARDVMWASGPSMRDKAEAQLLAAWLNFAHGSVGWDEMIDTDGDDVDDTPFHQVMSEAEATLLDAEATHEELEHAKDLAEAVNLHAL